MLPLLMYVMKFKAFRQNYICGLGGVQQGIYANLLAFDDWKVNKSRSDFSDLKVEICQHLAVLKTSSEAYFDDATFNNSVPSIIHLFEAKLESIAHDDLCKNELIVLQSSSALHSTFISCIDEFSKFWCGWVRGFPMLCVHWEILYNYNHFSNY